MGAVSEVPEAVLHALSDVDGANHAAFVAEPEPHRGMIAESRLVRQTNEPERAEFAISVAEQWHRRGLAMTMMRLLETKAAQLGVTVLYGVALPDNTAMRTLAGRLGYSTRPNTNDPRTVLLTKDLRRTERLH